MALFELEFIHFEEQQKPKAAQREVSKINRKLEAECCCTYVALSCSVHVLTPVAWTPDTGIIPQERLLS